jgi:hypothetical protein
MTSEKGLVHRPRRESGGSGALLVIVDSGASYWDHCIVDETVLAALEHFGMPYRILDLARRRPTGEDFGGCAAVLLAQDHVAGRLTAGEAEALAQAVEQGAGLVGFDNDLRACPAALLGLFGFERINPRPYATNVIRIRPADHYITGMQAPGEFHQFDRMVTCIMVEAWRPDVVPLAEGILGKDQLIHIRHLAPGSSYEPRNHPLLFAAAHGRGRAVQFTINPRVWRKAFFGHARGIDDLFWRSIVWAARKPFAACMIPPLVTMSFDDCSGRQDFAYVDAASRFGWTPMPGLFLKNIPERLSPKIREGMQSGRASYCTHAMSYYELMSYEFGRGECTLEKLKENFGYEDAWWERVGARPGCTVRLHWGEYGVNALPFYKERGRTFFCPALQTGLHKADMCMSDGFQPYGLQTCYYDCLPDDHDMFGLAAFLVRHQEDFLIGCTQLLRESEHNDLEKAARNAARCLLHGVRAGFFGEIVTHEQKFDVLSMSEWDHIMGRLDELTVGHELIRTTHDEIARYVKGKYGVWISEARAEGDSIACTLGGRTDAPLKLSVFRNEDEGVRRDYAAIDPFDGRATAG